jgi:hypothetical protein
MAVVNHFYNATTKKYIALFGTMFNKMYVARYDATTGDEVQRMIVPISYGPYQKFLARLNQDPELNRKTAITLPRMAFEITNMQYDGSRKINSIKKIGGQTNDDDAAQSFQYVGAPYNLDFSLYIMTKYAEDGTQLLEQILPFFKPEWTNTVKLIDNIDPLDIPLVLNSIVADDLYEADFETRRSLLWTLSFTMKGWYFGPQREKKVIKFIDLRISADTDASIPPTEQITIQPGLTPNREPTNDINETIPYEEISIDDDWGIITIYRSDVTDFEG